MSNLPELNREAWLHLAVEKLRPIFLGHGFTIPQLRVSVGWPSAGGLASAGKSKTIGQCWYGTATSDGKPQLFISPLLEDPIAPYGVLPVLMHEIAHTVAGPDAKHGPQFAKIATKLGLEGKPTATFAGEDLIARLALLSTELGPFPHVKINPMSNKPKQSCRQHKAECEACGYIARISKMWADFGPPICPCNHQSMKFTLNEK